ncbi:MAG: response regulator [Anaerolineales bacterium]|nr:response regulator [Anaerolineales bacterium]
MTHILLVEDNEMLQEILVERLELRDYSVTVASDGVQCLSLAVERIPDLILMDMSLPIMDGWEASRKLRAMPETAQVPIIAITAHALAGDRRRSLDAGCNDYEPKPLNFSRLEDKIYRLTNISC